MKYIYNYLLLSFFVLIANLDCVYSQQTDPFTRPIESIGSIEEFRSLADEMLNHRSLINSKVGVSIYSLDKRKFIYHFNQNLPLVPASVTKLFTTFFAFNQLGGRGTINTTIYTDALKITPELEGNLYIYGRGDALLNANDLEEIAANIRALGIVKIKGNIYSDGTFFDGRTSRFQYSGDRDEVQYVQPVTALSIDKNTASVIISTGSVAGRPVNVQILPTSRGFIADVAATVQSAAPSRRRGSVEFDEFEIFKENSIEFNPFQQNYGDYLASSMSQSRNQGGISITTSNNNAGKQVFRVTGSMRANTRQTRYFPMSSPDVVVAGALFERLRTAGIEIDGDVAQKQISSVLKNTTLSILTEFKRPLIEIANRVNKDSDNYLAENLYKMIGANAGNNENNQISANNYYKKMFDSLRLPTKVLSFNDGSGLSRRNRASTESITYLLELAYESKFFEEFANSLAIGGIDGTIRRRFSGSIAEGNILAKTGTHRNVSGLAGYIRTLDGELLCFAILANGGNSGQYKLLENRLGIMMAALNLEHSFRSSGLIFDSSFFDENED